jgi:hypothetical protein
MLKSLINQIKPDGKSEDLTYRLIRVIPGNLRSISVYAIENISRPQVMLDSESVKDYSIRGPLQRRRIADALDFEIRDGDQPVMGFHEGPANMWFSDRYVDIAEHCEKQGWLKFK